MTILLVQVGTTSPELAAARGDYDRWFREGLGVGDALHVARVHAGDAVPELGDHAAVIVSGSAAMVTDRAPWSVATAALLRDAVARGRHVLGVCYGHQLLADTFGGRVDYNPNGRQIGTVEARLTEAAADDPLLSGLGPHLVVQTSHSQCVLEPPPSAVVLARSPKDAHHALRLSDRVFGVQFHPEFDHEVARAYVEERAARIADEGADPVALAAAVRASDHGRRILRRFAELVASR